MSNGPELAAEIRAYGPDDRAAVDEVVTLGNAICAADSPWLPPDTAAGLRHRLRFGWDGEAPRGYALWVDGRVRGSGELWTSEYDNLDHAWMVLGVHPDWRRRGLGSRLLGALTADARRLGRLKVGVDGWDTPRTRVFAERHGLTARSLEVQRRQVLADTDWQGIERLRAEAGARAADYELVRIRGRCTEDLLPALAELTGAINDAPLDDLDLEDERFPVERVRGYEAAQLASGRLYRVLARHRRSGALAGHTVVHVEHDRPFFADQHDTSVAAAHRGHRLGLWLKTDMLQWLRAEEPEVTYVDTWNARSNAHMIAVNEALGYRVMGTAVAFQGTVAPARATDAPDARRLAPAAPADA